MFGMEFKRRMAVRTMAFMPVVRGVVIHLGNLPAAKHAAPDQNFMLGDDGFLCRRFRLTLLYSKEERGLFRAREKTLLNCHLLKRSGRPSRRQKRIARCKPQIVPPLARMFWPVIQRASSLISIATTSAMS